MVELYFFFGLRVGKCSCLLHLQRVGRGRQIAQPSLHNESPGVAAPRLSFGDMVLNFTSLPTLNISLSSGFVNHFCNTIYLSS